MSDEPDDDEFDAYELIAALKSIIHALGMPAVIWTKDPMLEHMNLRSRGRPEKGYWIFSVEPKNEGDEDGPVGHA